MRTGAAANQVDYSASLYADLPLPLAKHAFVLKILLVKTSSLGDVVHNLPVVNDIRGAIGDAAIDWVVEKAFADIPGLHPGVRTVIPGELRRWRRSWFTAQTRREWRAFVRELRTEQYDAVIDTQGLLKSALIAHAARGPRLGLDWRSSREPLRLLYDRTFAVPWGLHAVERNRRLCGLALGYALQGEPDYGLRCVPSTAAWLPAAAFVVLLHATSHPSKLWPEARWIELGGRLAALGFGIVLPWGSEAERQRATRLADRLPGAVVPERLALKDLAAVLAASAGALGVDTGLTHLAAALGVPVVGIYGATDPQATGVHAKGPVLNVGAMNRFPSVEEVVEAFFHVGVAITARSARQAT